MDSFGPFAAFIVTCLVIEITPGPNMAYLAIVSLSHGRLYGYLATAGVALGLAVIGFAAALGVATVISNSLALYQMLRIAGVLFLLWLAYEGWQDASENSPGKVEAKARPMSFFRHGFIVNILNPKAGVFFVTILPTFIDPSRAQVSQAVTLTFVYVAIATLVHVAIVTAASTAKPFLVEPGRTGLARKILSVLLGLIAVWLWWSTAR